MVLSNRRLKQKLREKLAQSLVASVAAKPNPKTSGSENPDPNSQPPSMKVLLDSASQKPRFSKREKRRKLLALRGPEAATVSGSGGNLEEVKGEEDKGDVGLQGDEKKEKKKRKRDGEEGKNGNLSEEENGDVMEIKKRPKKKNKKKKKRKSEVEKKGGEIGNGEEIVKEVVNENIDREANGDVPTKVYVGGIPYYSTEDDIRSYFESCGTITEVDCLRFPDSGKFRGIAIISFKTEAAAKRALALDGAEMGELFLKIQPYKATRVNKVSNKVSDFAPQIVQGYNKIYVGNLSWDITEDDLRKLFSDCKIASIHFGMDKETGEFRGYGHVNFSDSLSLTLALKLDQKIVCGRPVKISCAVPPKKAGTHSNSAATTLSTHSMSVSTTTTTDAMPVATTTDLGADNDGLSAGKIKRRTCYECGEKGHLSSACPNSATKASSTHSISVATPTTTYSRPVATTPSIISMPAATTTGPGADNGVLSAGKIKRRTCYECGEKGHLSSACPKAAAKTSSTHPISLAKPTFTYPIPVAPTPSIDSIPAATATTGIGADNGGLSSASGKIKRRTCYECGGKGHISSDCPKKQSAVPMDTNAS